MRRWHNRRADLLGAALVAVVALGAVGVLASALLDSSRRDPTLSLGPTQTRQAATTAGAAVDRAAATTSAARTTTAKRVKARTSAPKAASSAKRVRLTLVATAPVYVCLLAGQRVLVAGRTMQAGERLGPFRATRFAMTLGNSAVRMRINGGPSLGTAPTSPIGYVVDARGRRRLPAGALPTCGA